MTRALNRRIVLAGVGASLALPACQPSTKTQDADIIVMGAGLSGLHSAQLLSEAGYEVLVLEANPRPGGRLYTLTHSEGYTEGGGEQIGASYARIIDTARKLNVTLVEDVPKPRETGYFYQDKWFDEAGLKALPLFPKPFAGSTPSAPLFRFAGQARLFTAADDWRQATAKADISALDLLKTQNFSDEAMAVVERALNGNQLSNYSMLNLHRTMQLYAQSRGMGTGYFVKDGSQRLTEAMAKRLPRPVRYNAKIKHIKTLASGVEVTLESGKTLRAKQAVCTLPFGALRNIQLDAPLSEIQRAAIGALPYTQIFQVHFRASSPFWENDGLPADMWTDSPIERIFANRAADGRPTGLFRAWINGEPARKMGQRNETERRSLFLDVLHTIRPVTKNKVEVLNTVNWTETNPFANGAYMHWAPGQASEWAETMGQSVGALHFAGEHLGLLHTGMEAAMESAENTAFAIIDGS